MELFNLLFFKKTLTWTSLSSLVPHKHMFTYTWTYTQACKQHMATGPYVLCFLQPFLCSSGPELDDLSLFLLFLPPRRGSQSDLHFPRSAECWLGLLLVLFMPHLHRTHLRSVLSSVFKSCLRPVCCTVQVAVVIPASHLLMLTDVPALTEAPIENSLTISNVTPH